LPPKLAGLEAEKLVAEIVGRDYRLDIGDCFSRSWSLVRDNFWMLVGATALTLMMEVALAFVPGLGVAAAVFLALVFQGGLQWLFLKCARGERADIGDVFSGFTLAFVPLLLAGIVVHVLVVIGLAFCVAPGVYLYVVWRAFVPLLIIDKGLEFWPAMELSRKVVTKHWWQCFGLLLVAAFVGFLGLLGCGVGFFFTMPIAVGATVFAYRDIFGAQPAINELPAPPPPGPALTTPAAPEPAPAQPAPSDAGPGSSPAAPAISAAPGPALALEDNPPPESKSPPAALPPPTQSGSESPP
jgi:hypothetical protein